MELNISIGYVDGLLLMLVTVNNELNASHERLEEAHEKLGKAHKKLKMLIPLYLMSKM